MPAIPNYVQDCCQCLRGTGHAAHPVGGCVRDLLLGRTPEDWDVATSAHPEQVLALFDRTVPTGLKHGTVTVLLEGGHVEVTTFRREGAYADNRHPDAVFFDAGLSEDLARRDFTMNAMALSADGNVIDPFDGQADIALKRIRCVGDPVSRFREDALRMLRAVRFSAQLGFELDEATAAAILACAPAAAHVSAERVRVEVEKTITAPHPERGNLLFSMGLLSHWLDETALPDLSGLSALPPQLLFRWGGLTALLGSTAFLKKLKPDKHTAVVCDGVLSVLKAGQPRTDADWRKLLAFHGAQVTAIAAAIIGGREALERVLSAAPCYQTSGLALTGSDLQALGLRGAEIGAAQQRLLAHVLEHPKDNVKQVLHRLLESSASDD